MRTRVAAIVMAAMTGAGIGGCGGGGQAVSEPDPEPLVLEQTPVIVSGYDIGEDWPFNVRFASVACERGGAVVLVTSDGRVVPLNEAAAVAFPNAPELQDLRTQSDEDYWRSSDLDPTSRMSLQPIIERAEARC